MGRAVDLDYVPRGVAGCCVSRRAECRSRSIVGTREPRSARITIGSGAWRRSPTDARRGCTTKLLRRPGDARSDADGSRRGRSDCRTRVCDRMDAGGSFLPLPLTPPRGGAWVELTLMDGTVLRVPQHNLAALELVLTALSGRRPSLADEETRHA